MLKDIVKVVAPVAGGILSTVGPFAGPLGGPLAVLAGTALNAAGRLASESSLAEAPPAEGHYERALLAEAALQSVLKMSGDEIQESGLLDTMKKVFATLAPAINSIAPKIIPAILEPALRMAQDSLQKVQSGSESGFTPSTTPRKLTVTTSGAESMGAVDARTQQFLDRLLQPTIQTTGDEDFFGTLGDIFNTAVKAAPVVVKGIGILGSLFGESSFSPSPSEQHMQNLLKRAAMGEAALQALIQTPAEKLPESLWSWISDAVQTVGSTVAKVAPTVIKTVIPIVTSLLGESAGLDQPAPPRLMKSMKNRVTFGDMLLKGQGLQPGPGKSYDPYSIPRKANPKFKLPELMPMEDPASTASPTASSMTPMVLHQPPQLSNGADRRTLGNDRSHDLSDRTQLDGLMFSTPRRS